MENIKNEQTLWMEDSKLKDIPKHKLEFLQIMVFESKNLKQEEMLPFFMSVMKIMTSARFIAMLACSRMPMWISSSSSGSIPPVSIRVKLLPLQLLSAYILSRVTPGVSSTIDSLCPTM